MTSRKVFQKNYSKTLQTMKKATILGAIAGDVIGSVYEFYSTRNYNFELFNDRMSPTDDSVMTVAVADWILHDGELSHEELAKTMRKWGRKYPHAGYGGMFSAWLDSDDAGPYNSWGNGSAMRVSPVGFAFNTMEETMEAAKTSAEVTHNHPEGIKGAQATAAAIYLARKGKAKDEIRDYISSTFGYDLSKKCAEIRMHYRFYVSCQESVPQSVCAFLDSTDYESALRETISLGGDADTMGAITGGIACAYYGGMPDDIHDFAMSKLNGDMKDVVEKFDKRFMHLE